MVDLGIISIVAKPTFQCNRSCAHCYYLSEERQNNELLHPDDFESLMRMVASDCSGAMVLWHGGEPTLMPSSFFKKILKIEQDAFEDDGRIVNILMTNGVYVPRYLPHLIKWNDFILLLSSESPLIPQFRNGVNTSDKALALLNPTNRGKVQVTVSSEVAHDIESIYNRFRKNCEEITFVPIMPMGESQLDDRYLPSSEEFVNAMCHLFDIWISDTDTSINLHPISEALYSASTGKPFPICRHTGCFGATLCIVPGGEMYPCYKACSA